MSSTRGADNMAKRGGEGAADTNLSSLCNIEGKHGTGSDACEFISQHFKLFQRRGDRTALVITC